MNKKLKESKFTIDILSGLTFDGYSLSEEWNGWDMPYFTFEQANKVLQSFKSFKTFSGKTLEAYYDVEKDSFNFEVDSESEMQEFLSTEIEGRKFYPIGAGYWIWEEIVD